MKLRRWVDKQKVFYKNNQTKYISYVEEFSKINKTHIWLGGSFLHGNDTIFSDVDISVFCDAKILNKLIYGYGKPIYISYTSNPPGILIVIYIDGVAVDLEVIKKVNITKNEYFHRSEIKKIDYTRDNNICRQFAFSNKTEYQISRLFHRSLIKFLSGKADISISTMNEILIFMNSQDFIDESNYKSKFPNILNDFHKRFGLPILYHNLLCTLLNTKI